jgi:hypothetical protein
VGVGTLHVDAVMGLSIEVIPTILARFLYGNVCSINSAVDSRKACLPLPLSFPRGFVVTNQNSTLIPYDGVPCVAMDLGFHYAA